MRLTLHEEDTFASPEAVPPLLSLVPALEPLLEPLLDAAVASVQWGKDSTTAPVVPLVPVLVEAIVLPRLVSKHGTRHRFLPPASPIATRLSRLLVADDASRAATILRRLYAAAGSLGPLCATVIEPAARNIGDMWRADDCSQLDMTLALSRLQSIVRQLHAAASPVALGLPVVLVVPQPGEGHLLGAQLDAELLWRAGWDTHREFPATDHDLQTLVSETWFDVLDVSLSPALQRSDKLPSMAETISSARVASLNPALTVVVGGRAFFERYELSATVGADATTASALQVVLTASAARAATLAKLPKRNSLATRT